MLVKGAPDILWVGNWYDEGFRASIQYFNVIQIKYILVMQDQNILLINP